MQSLKYVRWRRVGGVLVLGLFLIIDSVFFNMARTASVPPYITTPTSLVITLNRVDLQETINGEFVESLLNQPATIDVVRNTGQATSRFDIGSVAATEYQGIRFTLAGTGTYSGIDPCTGDAVTDDPIDLPNVTDSELVLRYQVPHAVLGLQQGAIQTEPFKVRPETNIDFRLIFPATNSVGCIDDKPPQQTIAGAMTDLNSPFSLYVDTMHTEIGVSDNGRNSITIYQQTDTGNTPPQRIIRSAIGDDKTKLSGPQGIYIDTLHDEIGVANSNSSSITIYNRTDTDNTPPQRTISGAATGLDAPGGIYLDTLNDEIGVANGNSNSITIYNRTDENDHVPLRTITAHTFDPDTGDPIEINNPCGIAVDNVSNEIAVVNNGNNSITFYNRTDSGNVSPLRQIIGPTTRLNSPCGIFIDTNHDEIGVANGAGNSINFYNRLATGDVAPLRAITGSATRLAGPAGVYLDSANDEVAVANFGGDSVTRYKRNEAAPHLITQPIFYYPNIREQIFPVYYFSGTIDKNTGTRLLSSPILPPDVDLSNSTLKTPRLQGYAFTWRIYDGALKNGNDATNAFLIPPVYMQFVLADLSTASNLQLGCPAFTPFITDELSTKCFGQPLIARPFPAPPTNFRVAGTLQGKDGNKAYALKVAPLGKAELPLLLPTLTLGNGSILKMDWYYTNAATTATDSNGDPLPTAPIIYNQQFSITLNRPFSEVSSCYKMVSGTTLIFSSGALGPAARSLDKIKNNNCDIFLKDVSTITFTISDAYETRYNFTWTVE